MIFIFWGVLGIFASFICSSSLFWDTIELEIVWSSGGLLFSFLRVEQSCMWSRYNLTLYWISCEELTHWKRLWCWEELGAGEEGDDRGWDGWMASLTRWTWVWVNSESWWWTGRPGVLWFMGSQRVGHNWATELNWSKALWIFYICILYFLFCILRFFHSDC